MFVKQKGGVRTQNRRQQQNMSLSKKISTEPNLAISSIMLFNEQWLIHYFIRYDNIIIININHVSSEYLLSL